MPEARAGAVVRMPLTRRSLLRAVASVASGSGILGLAGCGPARPVGASQRLILRFVPMNALGNNLAVLGRALWEVTAPFRQSHPGIELRMSGWAALGGGYVAPIVAGDAPDIIYDLTFFPYASQGLIVDLEPYLRQDNVDLNVFSSGATDRLQWNGHLLALPSFVNSCAMVVNQGELDRLGLPYPDPEGDYQAWARTWQASSGESGGRHRYGGGVLFWFHGLADFYFRGWGAHVVDPNDPARCVLDDAAAVACGEFLLGLLLHGAVTTNNCCDAGAKLTAGEQVSAVVSASNLPVQVLAALPKWDFYPMPRWPSRPAAFTHVPFYAISASSRYPAAAWELLRWMCIDPAYQRAKLKLVFQPPALKSVWGEYAAVARAVVPQFGGKRLSALQDPVIGNEVYTGPDFRYASDQAYQIIVNMYSAIVAGRIGVKEAFAQAARQVNALETAAASETPTTLAGLRAARTGQRLRLGEMFSGAS